MKPAKSRFGTLFLLLALPIIGADFYLYSALPAGIYPTLYQQTLPVIGLILGLLVFFLGHFSYQRIHSVKIYFFGYSAGLTTIAYFLLYRPFSPLSEISSAPVGISELIILIQLINLLIIPLFPADAKYKLVRSLTLAIIGSETVLLLVCRFGFGTAGWLISLIYTDTRDLVFWAGPALFLLVLAHAAVKVKNEFHLGGIICGSALLSFAAWMARICLNGAHSEIFNIMLFSSIPLYCSISIVLNSFFRMEHRISFDPLLQIYNRDYCSRIITEQASMNTAAPFGIAMVDIDHFKSVNDTYGHQAGDAVLHAVAQTVKNTVGAEGIACRYGGEELAVFFPGKNSKEVSRLSEEIRLAIEKVKTKSGKKTISVTISVGVSHRENSSQSIVDVIKAADKALYAAKEGGRNQVKTQKTSSAQLKK